MKVRDLIEALQRFDGDMEVKIGMQQTYGTDFAMDVNSNIAEHKIRAFYGRDYKAVVITEGNQCGAVVYDEEDAEDWL